MKKGNFKHGEAKVGKWTKIYRIWRGMIQRCYVVSHTKYHYYGAKGIKVCDEWRKNYLSFKKWAEENYSDKLQIDRIDNKLGYSPKNCRWVTPRQNSNNKTNNTVLFLRDGKMNIMQAARFYKIPYSTLKSRMLINGLSAQEAIDKPYYSRSILINGRPSTRVKKS